MTPGGGRLVGAARYAVAGLAAAGLLLAINHTFNLALLGFRPISTGYYYHLIACFLPAALLAFPPRARAAGPPRWFDWLLAAAAFASAVYLGVHAETILMRGWDIIAPLTPTLIGGLLCLLALEGVRRCAGTPLLVICTAFALFPLVADRMPGVLWGNQFAPLDLMRAHAMGAESLIGVPIRVVADLLIGFILFGIALTVTGGGRFFMDLACALLGRTRGGPAKVSVVASGLFGSLSGSVVSNVVTTGAFTIPAMRRAGYDPRYAAAVEACASTGGALMPPVMGTAAFLMASFLDTSYASVVVAAIVPSLLFYATLLLQADGYAARRGLEGLPEAEIPALAPVLAAGWMFLLSLAALVYLLLVARIESLAPWIATALLLVAALTNAQARARLADVVGVLVEVGRTLGQLVAILAAVGLIVGSLSLTGVGNAFARELVQYAGGNLYLLLLFGALTSFVLGMGMTVSACYVFLAVILAPALVKAGVLPLAAHLFVLYWGILSFITPPVALAAVAAAGIVGAPPMATGVVAMRLGALLFVVPFLFALNPALILAGTPAAVLLAVATAGLSVWLLAAALEGYLQGLGRVDGVARALALVAGVLLIVPEWRSDLTGLALAVTLVAFGRVRGAMVAQETGRPEG